MDHPMKSLVDELLESYAHCGGIKHLDGASLPSKMAVAALTQDLLHIIFPGFIGKQHDTWSPAQGNLRGFAITH